MELNPEALDGLKIIGDSSLIPDTCFGRITEDLFNFATGLTQDNPVEQVAGVDGTLVKQSANGLLTAIYEGAKINGDSAVISSTLEESKWTQDRIEFFLKKFEECKQDIRAELSRIGTSYPHVVDVNWRLDYYIKNNYLDKINEPRYLLSLKTQEHGTNKPDFLEFSCSVDELQDLVGKLKDASKILEKSAHA